MHPRTHATDPELLSLMEEREATAPHVRKHVDGCDTCRARQHVLRTALSDTLQVMRDPTRPTPDLHAASRAALRVKLAVAAASDASANAVRLRVSSTLRWTAAAAMVVIGVAVLMALGRNLGHRADTQVEYDALPIRHVTPGATAEVSLSQICSGRAPDPTPADPSVREQVLAAYGMAHVPEHEYELDYLISPALGGANDPRNLWPERYTNRRWNAKVKDQLEDLLPSLVCEGKVDLQTAQRDIAADWVEAYKKYFKTQVPLGSS